MKKSIKALGLAVLAMVALSACNNNKAAEEADTTLMELIDSTIENEAIDTVVAIVEEVAPAATTTKKPATKTPTVEEQKPAPVKTAVASQEKVDPKANASQMKENTGDTKAVDKGGKKSAKDLLRKGSN